VRTGGDTSLSEEVFRNGSKLVTKLWNAVRFGTGFLENYDPPAEAPVADLNPTDRWLLARLSETIGRATDYFSQYEFAAARIEAEKFFWTDLCDNYLELVKARIYDGEAPGACYTLHHALLSVTKLLAPFVPHVTDAVYVGAFAASDGHHSVHVAQWPQCVEAWTVGSEHSIEVGNAILAVTDSVRRWKSDRKLSVAAPLGSIVVSAPASVRDALRDAERDLLGVTRASKIFFAEGEFDHVACVMEEVSHG
jgi:valyl-tRNA synthetase